MQARLVSSDRRFRGGYRSSSAPLRCVQAHEFGRDGSIAAKHPTRSGAPLWSRQPIREQRLHRPLKAHGIQISMSRKGNPWDNAACESLMKTLKYEEVLRNEYRDLAEARASIPEFLEKVYNQKRLHSALGYLPPVEFEAQLKAQNMEVAARQRVA